MNIAPTINIVAYGVPIRQIKLSSQTIASITAEL
jgi:hypothetical protein